MKTLTLAWTLLSLAASASALDLLHLGSPSGPLSTDWTMREVSGVRAPRLEVRVDHNQAILRIEGAGTAGFFYRVLGQPISSSKGRLNWSWRVLQAPAGADLSVVQRDDSALRVYVVFGSPKGLGALKAKTIFYCWGNSESAESLPLSPDARQLRIVSMGGSEAVGEHWRHESVDPFNDFRRFWSQDPPAIEAVGFIQDTDATGSRAVAELHSLRWDEAPDEAPAPN